MATKARATDFTGRQRETLMKTHAEELSVRQQEIALQNQVESERFETEVTDLTGDAPTIIDEVEVLGVGMADNSLVMRVNDDIEQMTFGRGNTYDFKAGAKYKVSKDLYDYLDSLGYVWH